MKRRNFFKLFSYSLSGFLLSLSKANAQFMPFTLWSKKVNSSSMKVTATCLKTIAILDASSASARVSSISKSAVVKLDSSGASTRASQIAKVVVVVQ